MLNRNKLEELLTNVTKNICVIHEFENMLWSVLKDTVSMPNWPLEHFLCLAIPLQSQCTLIERLQGKKFIPHGYTGYIVSNDAGVDDAELCVMSTVPTLNNIPAGKNNIYVLVQEAPGICPSGLYFIDKRFNKIYVSPLTFSSHGGLLKLTKKLFPESGNNIYSDIKRLSSEQLSEITLTTGHSQIQKGRVYLQSDKSSVKYTLKLPSEEIITDTVSNALLGINQLFDENQLGKVWPEIMRVTFQRGHTHLAQNGYEIHHGLINKPEDLELVIKEIFSDYDEAFEYFKSLKHISKFDFSMPPIKWLEQCHSAENTIGKYDINSRPIGHKHRFNMPLLMETIILSQHFQLDVEKVINENGVLDGTRCKIEKAAEILNVDVENVISECQKKSMGVYLKKGKFKIDRYAANPITIENINQNRKIAYDYCYKGLVRLLDGSLDYFYEDDVIKCKDNDSYRMIHLQSSLGQLIQGITASHIRLRRNESIERGDCIFIEEELIASINRKNLKEKNDQDKDILNNIWGEVSEKLHGIINAMQPGNRRESSAMAISLILDAVKKIRTDFDPMQMPGSVIDFFIFCKSIPNGEKIFSYQKNTFRKYCTGVMPENHKKTKSSIRCLCKWGKQSKPNKKYWESLKPNNRSYTVNLSTF